MTRSQEAGAAPFEPFNPTWRRSPIEAYEQLLRGAPVYRSPSGHYVLSRYSAVRQALASPDIFSSRCIDKEAMGLPRDAIAQGDPATKALLEATFHGIAVTPEELATVRTVIGSDGVDHTRQRKLIDRAFSPARVRALKPAMDAIAARCADMAATADTFDVMNDLAYVLPRQIIGELLSVEEEKRADLTRWTHEMMGATSGAERNTEAAHQQLMAVLHEFAAFFVPRIDARRVEPTDDFISELVRAESDDRLTSLETLLLIRLLMIAGTDTTGALIGNTILHLLRDPEQAWRLRENPDLIPTAIEESLRYWAPFYFVLRETTQPTEIDGEAIPEGSLVAIMIGAANHDGAQFGCPADFDTSRKGSHMAFGHGAHFCVGSHLARAEAHSAITAILPYLDRFELADEPLELAESQFFQGFKRLNLVAKKQRAEQS